MQFLVVIKTTNTGKLLREYVYASSTEQAVRAVVGTLTTLGRYSFRHYTVVSVGVSS